MAIIPTQIFINKVSESMATTAVSALSNLPIFSGRKKEEFVLDGGVVKPTKQVNTVSMLITIALTIGIGYALLKYILPMVLQVTTISVGIISTICIFMFAVANFGNFKTWLANNVEANRKKMISANPISFLNNQLTKHRNEGKAVGDTINALELERKRLSDDANKSEEACKKLESDFIHLTTEQERILKEYNEFVKSGVNDPNKESLFNRQITSIQGDAKRKNSELKQEKNFVVNYSANARLLDQIIREYMNLHSYLKEEEKDLEVSIRQLTREMQSAEKLKQTNKIIDSALGFKNKKEVEYAIAVANDTLDKIYAESANSIRNFREKISGLNQYSIEEQSEILKGLVADIQNGNSVIPNANRIQNPRYQMTSEERTQAGRFGSSLFD